MRFFSVIVFAALIFVAGCKAAPVVPAAQIDPATVVANPKATLAEKEAALKVAVQQVADLKKEIKKDKDIAIQRKFGWLIALFALIALGCGAAAWFLPVFKSVAIKGAAFCGAMIAVLTVLIKLTPYFGSIAIWFTVGLTLAAAIYLFTHTKKIHDQLNAAGIHV